MSAHGFGPGVMAYRYLDIFGALAGDAFGAMAYLVGSAATSHTFRDVDVRVILDDDEWVRRFGPIREPMSASVAWSAEMMAWCALAEKLTGLPVDFQVQPRTVAAKEEGPRNPLGVLGPLNRLAWEEAR